MRTLQLLKIYFVSLLLGFAYLFIFTPIRDWKTVTLMLLGASCFFFAIVFLWWLLTPIDDIRKRKIKNK